jgi:hypothetical protein
MTQSESPPVRLVNRSGLDTVWLDYDELATRLGIVRESARQHAKRKGWPRRKANDGRTQVGVPEEALSVSDPVPEYEPGSVHELDREPGIPGYIDRHIERLEQALAEAQEKARALEQEREAARDAARLFERERDAVTAQVEALNTVLTIERARVDEWKIVADRFAMQAEALAARRGLFGWLRRA